MTTRLLIIHRQLVFAVTLKQALEQTGAYDVHAFTVPDAALEYLQSNPQDVALVDFMLAGRALVAQLRAVQRDLAIIVSPRQPETLARELRVQGMIDQPFTAREIMPLIEDARAAVEALGDTELSVLGETEMLDGGFPPAATSEQLSAPDEAFDGNEGQGQPARPPTLPEFSSLDSVLVDEAPSEIFEPPVRDGDTPSVPEVSSGAVRQFIATRGSGADDFDSVLDDLDEQAVREQAASRVQSNSFTELVNSMRGENAHTPLPDRHQQFIDFILTGGMDVLLSEIEKAKTGPLAAQPADEEQSSQVFDKLAAEEPPMPTLEESGTVGDLMLGVSDPGFRNVLAMMRGEEVPEGESRGQPRQLPPEVEEAFAAFFESQMGAEKDEAEVPDASFEDYVDEFSFPTESGSSIPAQLILETALDESTAGGSFSLDELIASIDNQLARHRPDVRPLPSWDVRFKPPPTPEEKYIKEPDFLPEEFPSTTQVPSVAPETPPHVPEVVEEADTFEPDARVADGAVFDLPAADMGAEDFEQDEQAMEEVVDSWDELPEAQTDAAEAWPQAAPADFGMSAEFDLPVSAVPLSEHEPDNAYIAQIALSLTQVSLELAAEATLLTHNGEVVAVAGQLLPEDIAALQDELAQGAAEYGDAPQIRFITLASNGKNYMLYSRHTEGDFTLSMVFADTTPLRDIRNQGKRLADALAAVPEMPLQPPVAAPESFEQALEREPEAPAVEIVPVDAGPLAPYTYVWLLRDPDRLFDEPVARAIAAGLRTQLTEQGWRVHQLDVRDEYVYLLADAPAETPAYELVGELKLRAGRIAQAQNPSYVPEMLWADSYLVLTPGRELMEDEITQFINFERLL